MEKYKNEDFLKHSIIDYSRHKFIYGKNSDHRSDFLKEIELDYPLEVDSTRPCAIYIDDFGMPKYDYDIKGKDTYLIQSMCREFFAFTVASKLLEKASIFDSKYLSERLKRLIYLTDKYKNSDHSDIKTFDDLLRELKLTRDFYYRSFLSYISEQTNSVAIDQVSVPFIQLESFITVFKEGLNIDSFVGILLDKKGDIAIPSIKTVNSFIGSRINKDVSMNVAVEPSQWPTYFDENNQFVEAVHDYGYVELDDSYHEYMDGLIIK